MENKDFEQLKGWYKNKKFKNDKGVVGTAYKTIIAPMYKDEVARRNPPSRKTVNYFNDLAYRYNFKSALPKDFKPRTQKEYGLGITIMEDAQYKATGGKYGKPRKSTLNKEKQNGKKK